MSLTNVTWDQLQAAQSFYQKGKRFRVIKEGAFLSGTKPTAEWTQKGIGHKIPIGTILTCQGFVGMMGSDSGRSVGWTDENGKHIMNHAKLEPSIWSQFMDVWPEEGYLEPI